MCKAAHGVADDIVSTMLSNCDVPILFAPAMNFRMWDNKATIDAVKILKTRGSVVVNPEEGYLASLHKGKGRLADINTILNINFEANKTIKSFFGSSFNKMV